MTNTRLRLAGAAVAVGLLIAGTSCGTSDSGSESTASTESTAAPTTEAEGSSTTTAPSSDGTVAPSEEDQQIAEAAIITADDVPAGFEQVTSESSNKPNPFLGIAECAPFEDSIKAADDERTAKAEIDFQNAAEDIIKNQVEIYVSSEVATDSADALGDPGYADCIEATFTSALTKEGLPPEASIDSMEATRMDIASAEELGVDSANAFALELSITVEGQTLNMSMGIAMLTSGRALTQVGTQSTSGQIDMTTTLEAAAKALAANAPS